MSQPEASPTNNSRQPSAFVRFTPEQYRRLRRDQLETGKSIPELLRTVYFQRGIPRPLFDAASAKLIRRELASIGNNVNQLARRVNSGLIEGAVAEIVALTRAFLSLRALLLGIRSQSKEEADGGR